MAKATLTLDSGAVVSIEGSVEEVNRLLRLHERPGRLAGIMPARSNKAPRTSDIHSHAAVSIDDIVNHVRSCEEAEQIETRILAGRSQILRTLLPLYIVQKYLGDRMALSASEIAQVCRHLRTPVAEANISKALRGPAARYVMIESGESPKRYRLNRRGAAHISSVLAAPGKDAVSSR